GLRGRAGSDRRGLFVVYGSSPTRSRERHAYARTEDRTMTILLQLIYSGIALGMIYAVIAFGYQLTFATSGTLNFGQGEALMLGAMVGLTLVGNIHGGPYMSYLLAIPVVVVFG